MTSAIARMNCFLHGVEDFEIIRGDTLAEPKFIKGDKLQTFDVVLANPPYSIKQWNREGFASDPFGRNILGTPPQNNADFAFFQHILGSMNRASGRCAILFPHGVLFRLAEKAMRQKLIELDLVDAVIGLGKNLFYNSIMISCVVICSRNKSKKSSGNVEFIDAKDLVQTERTQSFLNSEHIATIVKAYRDRLSVAGFTAVVTNDKLLKSDASLRISNYVKSGNNDEVKENDKDLGNIWRDWETSSQAFWDEMDSLVAMLDSLNALNGGNND